MNQEQFIKKINIVLVEIDKMINNCDEYSYTNNQQLISIKNELYDMINYLNSESIFQQKKGKEFFLNCNMKLNSIQIYNFINFFKKDFQGRSII